MKVSLNKINSYIIIDYKRSYIPIKYLLPSVYNYISNNLYINTSEQDRYAYFLAYHLKMCIITIFTDIEIPYYKMVFTLDSNKFPAIFPLNNK